MEIKKVIADKYYKENYIQIDGIVYSFSSALSKFFNNDKTLVNEWNNKDFVNISYNKMASKEELIKIVNKERNAIFKNLKIKEIKNNEEKIITLVKYIVENITYHEPTMEELKFDLSKHSITKIEERELNTNFMVQSIYKVLKENKGVCSHISYAFNFLLNELNIPSKVLHITYEENGEKAFHALNIFKLNKENIFIDLTEIYFVYHNLKKSSHSKDKQMLLLDNHIRTLGFIKSEEEFDTRYKNAELVSVDYSVEKPVFTSEILVPKTKEMEKGL